MDYSIAKEIELQIKSKFPNRLEAGDRCKATILLLICEIAMIINKKLQWA